MTNPVIITRPVGQAELLAQLITAIGHEAVVFPLLEIQPLPDPSLLCAELARLDDYALVAFVSPNAIAAAFSMQPKWPAHLMFAVVGEGSRNALARHGITDANATVISPRNAERTDSETLLEALDLDRLKNKRVLIIRGETGRELLAERLRNAGIKVTQVAAYRRVAPALDAGRATQLRALLARPCDWIITSSEALHILLDMTRQIAGDEGVAQLQQQRLIVPHHRIAETAHMLNFSNVSLTGSGDENLIAALQS